MAAGVVSVTNTALTAKTVVDHWVMSQGCDPLQLLQLLLSPPPVVQTGQFVAFAGTSLCCPAAAAPLLYAPLALAREAAVRCAPAALAAVCLSQRDSSTVGRALFAAVKPVLCPAVAPALRCLRADLQHFVAGVAHCLARAGAGSAWVADATKPCWVVAPGSAVATDIAEMVALAETPGQITIASVASLSFGGDAGVLWLQDDKLLILLLLLFGPPQYLCSAPPNLPPPLQRALDQPWRTAMHFSSTTP